MDRRLVLVVAALAACAKGGHEPGDTGVTDDTDTDVADTDVDTDTNVDTDTDVDTDTNVDTDTDTGLVIPDDNLAKVAGDCEGHFREPDAFPNQLIPGDEMQRYTLASHDAVCNDGTRAVIYVRGYTDDALKSVWSLHLQGGGGCNTWQDCAVRWCGLQYYDASKMSSRWAPEDVGAVGIYDADPGNLLSGANQVFFYYCSSDSWSGQGTGTYDAPAVDTGAIPDALPSFTMFRHGHTILADALEELEAGVVADGGEAMPALSDASLVVLSGTSAGSDGAIHNADWVTAQLASNGTSVYAIFDAEHTPPTQYWPSDLQDDLAARRALAWDVISSSSDVRPFLDESCVAEVGDANAGQCNDLSYVMTNHVTTPFFVRQDLRDVTDLAESLGISEDDYQAGVASMLGDLGELQSTAIEGDDIARAPGAYGPNCAQHVALETNDWWRTATVEDTDGVPTTFQAAVGRWYQGEDVSIVDEPTTGGADGPLSVCADPDPGR